MMGVFFSAGVVGLYALTMKVIQTPVGLIHQAISQVFYREAAAARMDGSLDRLVGDLFASLSKAALIPCLLLLVAGRDLFVFVFGPAWDQAGLFAQILAPWVFVWFITSPLSVIYLALERQEEEIKVQSTIFTARCVSLLLGGYIGVPVVAVTLFSLSGVLAYTYLFFIICRCAEIHALRTVVKLLPDLATGLLASIPSVVAVSVGMPQVVIIVVVLCTVVAHAIFLTRSMRGLCDSRSK
jgi:O-antigen/teichoic acid export membrane protein